MTHVTAGGDKYTRIYCHSDVSSSDQVLSSEVLEYTLLIVIILRLSYNSLTTMVDFHEIAFMNFPFSVLK